MLVSELIVEFDPLTNELKTGKNFLELDAVVLADRSGQFARYDSRYGKRTFRKRSRTLLGIEDIVEEHESYLVSGKRYIGLFTINSGTDGNTDTVTIRVSADDQIRVYLLCKIDRHGKSGRIFRVRNFYRREVSVRELLFRNDMDILQADLL